MNLYVVRYWLDGHGGLESATALIQAPSEEVAMLVAQPLYYHEEMLKAHPPRVEKIVGTNKAEGAYIAMVGEPFGGVQKIYTGPRLAALALVK